MRGHAARVRPVAGPRLRGRVLGLSGRWARPALGWLGCCGSCAGARMTRDDRGGDGLSGSGGPARLVPVAGDEISGQRICG